MLHHKYGLDQTRKAQWPERWLPGLPLAQALARLGDEPNARKHREEYAKLKAAELAVSDRRRVDRLKTDLADLRPMAARFLAWTGEIYASHGQVDKAEQLWVTSLAIDPAGAET